MYHYNIILCNADKKKKGNSCHQYAVEKQVDGLLFMGGTITEEHLQAFNTSNVPIVLCATSSGNESIPYVDIDHERAAMDAVSLLMNKDIVKSA